jgi:hypothetical protein
MLGWQLTLPVARRRQWIVKVFVALLTSAVLGMILPILLFELCKWLFHFPLNPFTNPNSPLGNDPDQPGYLLWLLVYLVVPCMAIMASSLSTNSMRAAVLTLVMIVLGFVCIQPAVMTAEWVVRHFQLRSSWLHIYINSQMDHPMIGVTILLILGLILFLSFRNYTAGEVSSRRRWLHPLILLLWINGCLFALDLVMALVSWN